MKRKKPYIRLTNSEFAMMQLLWEAGRPLNRAEIMEIALRDPENPLFAKNSFHVIISSLQLSSMTAPAERMPAASRLC